MHEPRVRAKTAHFFYSHVCASKQMATNSCTAAAFWSFGPDFWIETARKGGIPGQTSTGFLVVAGVAEMAFSHNASIGKLYKRVHILCFGGLISGLFWWKRPEKPAFMPENGWFWLKSAKNPASRAGFLHVWLAVAESAEMVAFSYSASLGQLHKRLHILCFGGLISGLF